MCYLASISSLYTFDLLSYLVSWNFFVYFFLAKVTRHDLLLNKLFIAAIFLV